MHNKVVVWHHMVVTGSFNFLHNTAENAENVLGRVVWKKQQPLLGLCFAHGARNTNQEADLVLLAG